MFGQWIKLQMSLNTTMNTTVQESFDEQVRFLQFAGHFVFIMTIFNGVKFTLRSFMAVLTILHQKG